MNMSQKPVKLVIAITHTPWRPERVLTYNALRDQLSAALMGWEEMYVNPLDQRTTRNFIGSPERSDPKYGDGDGVGDGVGDGEGAVAGDGAGDDDGIIGEIKVFDQRMPFWEWSEAVWNWAAESTTATHFLMLQDDAILCDDFLMKLEEILQDRSGDILGLQVAHPLAGKVWAEGSDIFTTTDMLVGVGYCLPISLLRKFIWWRNSALRTGALEAIPEDTLLGLFATLHGHRIFHPLPPLVDHDTSIPSTCGNDEHPHRKCVVPLNAPLRIDENTWSHARTSVWWPLYPHLGLKWGGTLDLAKKWVIDFSDDAYLRLRRDDGAEAMRVLNAYEAYRNSLSAPYIPKVMIAIPTRGELTVECAMSVWETMHWKQQFDVTPSFVIDQIQCYHEDIVRTRSRMVHHFLYQTTDDYLLFLDSDIQFDPVVIVGMMAAMSGGEKHFVAAPYPKRDYLNFDNVWAHAEEIGAGAPAESFAHKYAIRVGPSKSLSVYGDNTMEIDGIGLGCALISRQLLEQMVKEYKNLEATDGSGNNICMLFDLLLRPLAASQDESALTALTALGGQETRELLSEDFSFCHRITDMGEKVYMYLGVGSPVTHIGTHKYQGRIESFGLCRGTKKEVA